ncbi:MAG TPA: type II CAAX endopeptidase family protein [Candidatus Acidoferrales bacterium]|nr:type II CAAX endopeptidase family protein [Candidatus Acidoferrales bacterium]
MNISSAEPKAAISEETASQRSASGPDFAVQPSYVRTVFLGPDGLRAGWGIAFYVAMFYPLQFVASRWAGSLELGANGLWSTMLEEFGLLCAAVIPSLLLGRVEARTWGAYGLPGRQAFRKLFWVGAVWGFASITLLLALMFGLRVFDVGHLAMHGTRILRFGLFWAVMFLLVGFFEEFLLRGYSQFTLTRAIGFWPAAVFLSCLFGLIHIRNGGEEWPGLLAAAVIGFFFCLTLRRTGNLWFAVGFHAAWDWGETFFYSVPDSGTIFPGHLLKSSFHGPGWLTGGRVGPEGSVLCFVVIAAVWAGFARAYPEVRYRVPEAFTPGIQRITGQKTKLT